MKTELLKEVEIPVRSLKTITLTVICLAFLSGCAGSSSWIKNPFGDSSSDSSSSASSDSKSLSSRFGGASSEESPASSPRSGSNYNRNYSVMKENWIRFRPEPTSAASGAEDHFRGEYSGQVSITYATVDYEFLNRTGGIVESGSIGPTNAGKYSSVDGYGLWISARPNSWYIAPEIGYHSMVEDGLFEGIDQIEDLVVGDTEIAEVFIGARIIAELPFTPFSIIAGGGYSKIETKNELAVDLDPSIDFDFDTRHEGEGGYVHIGALLHLGDNAHIGVNLRKSEYDSADGLDDRELLSVMAGWNW